MPNGVLFDLDGTLVDTSYLHAVTWWQAMRQYGLDVPMARIHRAVGMGSDKLLDHLLGQHDDTNDDKMRDAHSALYAVYWDRLRPTPGARDLIREVAGRDARVVLASSAAEPELKALLRALDVDGYVDTSTGADDADESKPAPDIIQVALERSNLDADEVVFIGDSVWDVYAASKLSIPCVCVICGGVSEAELREAGAAQVYDHPQAALDAIDEWWS